MEPVTTTAMIGTVAGYLVKTLKDNKSVKDFFNDFTAGTVKWIRPLFLKDENQYEKIIEDLIKNPDSPAKKQIVESTIASHLEDNPTDEQQLKEMYEKIKAKGSVLTVKNLDGKKGVEVKAKMKDSKGTIEDVKSDEGNVNVDLDLS